MVENGAEMKTIIRWGLAPQTRTEMCNHCNGCGEIDTFDLHEVVNGRIKCPTCDGEGSYLVEIVKEPAWTASGKRSTYSDQRSNSCNRP